MATRLYTSVYKEQFASPGRVQRQQLRPTSAHRRNNPQPHPDFLFPRSLRPAVSDRQLFPPVRHLSFHAPDKPAGAYLKPGRSPAVDTSAARMLPSVSGAQSRTPAEPAFATDVKFHVPLRNPGRDVQKAPNPFSAQPHRKHASAPFWTKPQTGLNPAAQNHFPLSQKPRSGSGGMSDYSGRCSCFHVVKPFQAGHYVIHPEFASEFLRFDSDATS